MAGKVTKAKKAEPGETPAPASLNPTGKYVIIATGGSYMKPCREYEVSGKLAETLIKKGSATLKTE